MRSCYRPLLVFAPSLDHPQLVSQFNQLKVRAIELKSRTMMYVPIVPEGHNQPIPGSKSAQPHGSAKMSWPRCVSTLKSNRLTSWWS